MSLVASGQHLAPYSAVASLSRGHVRFGKQGNDLELGLRRRSQQPARLQLRPVDETLAERVELASLCKQGIQVDVLVESL